jgi:Fe2+ or Zn2+ uptake regulation protein
MLFINYVNTFLLFFSEAFKASQNLITFRLNFFGKERVMRLEKETVDVYSKNKNHDNSLPSNEESSDRLVCVSCGKAVKINYPFPEQDRDGAEANSGFQLQSHRLILYGYCQSCPTN